MILTPQISLKVLCTCIDGRRNENLLRIKEGSRLPKAISASRASHVLCSPLLTPQAYKNPSGQYSGLIST